MISIIYRSLGTHKQELKKRYIGNCISKIKDESKDDINILKIIEEK